MIRIGKTKVRTGCFTCKRRRVKCDEARPACNRCIKAGKPCEGYAINPNPGSGYSEPVRFVVYAPRQPNPLLSEHPDLDWSERRALSYFQDRTALELAGSFHNDFWMSHILPLARQEGAVRHALIALSSMHEHYSGVDHYSPTRGVDFALDHYGKSMREVARFNQSHPDQTFEFALVTCALFSTFESLQGRCHEACNHAISGIRILAEEQRKSVSDERPTRIPREALARFFIASGRQILELGDPNWPGSRPELYYTKSTMPTPDRFISHEHALLHIELLLWEIIEYVERTDVLAEQGPISEDVALSLMAEFHTIKLGFDKWKTAFEIFSASESNEFSRETPESMSSGSSTASSPAAEQSRPARSPAFLILRVYYSLMTAFLARIESNDEAAFNEYVPDLLKALDAAEEFIYCTSTYVSPMDKTSPSRSPLHPTSFISQPPLPPVVRPTFSLALGIVPTLFLIASRASDPGVRDRALRLLRTCNRREGLWDSNLAAKICERMIELRQVAAQMETHMDIQSDVDRATDDMQTLYQPQNTRVRDQAMPSIEETIPSSPGTSFSAISGPTPGVAGVNFKLLDIKFLPDRRCVMRYSFIRDTGVKVLYPTIPTFSDHERLTGARQYQGEYFEEITWEG
ncbi:hypothetical protein H2200_005042 [Cladophialophora chaetospira]|uniref:Zn(2)-C6 fungal-type domain-containing protein n=1 Tax=Cladophialophora chaetospira TaxID=386627 RepID=A0AA38XB87_9EURO|nr:hypothetical protein H2200_005042 [Cladophialophora chaetospira]